ncbi:LuxR C-terminal-related transcriptional regulator [Paraburkholderia youngii]|uniref:helix-turn-helix transcriptional regulator n=1 Tax=Paraburkholderia youngii TaxID=2782701 RepID=UPI003D1F309A
MNTSLANIFDLFPVGLLYSTDRTIDYCNESFASMFLYSPTDLMGRTFELLYPTADDYELAGEIGRSRMKATGVYGDDRLMRRRSGELFWCRTRGRTLDLLDPLKTTVWVFEDLSRDRPYSLALTTRERQIAQLLIEGKSSKVIANTLDISFRTVDAHRGRMMRKLGVTAASSLVSKLINSQ